MAVPVIFLGCADPSKTLRLTTEFNAIEGAFANPLKNELCELEKEYNLHTGILFRQFNRSRSTDRIAVFHFSGHAGSYGLLLQDMAVQGSALNAFLKEYNSLRLVFLNGCATREQAAALAKDGPAVIGTIRSIEDNVAVRFADLFYQLLADDNDLDTSFRRAQSGLALAIPGLDKAGGFPFELFATDDQNKWKLSDEIKNPYFGLPLPKRGFLPPDPYISIRPYTESEWPVFWGRGADIRNLYLAMMDETRNPLMLLYGQSGVGKSSLLDAGLVPRLNERTTVLYARRLPDKGLSKTFLTRLNIPVQDPVIVIKHFSSLYAEHKKPVIFIMDQVEEVFTNPLKDDRNELIGFLQLVGQVLRSNLSFIKITLGYRKEFHAEIEAEVRNADIPFTTYFLQPLNIDNLTEIITGSQSTSALRQHYRIRMDLQLENLIATEISSDTNSPVAPMVQILMTKMWERVRKDESRNFTYDLYRELKEQGIALSDFVNEKIETIAKVYPTEVRSGLLLDLLYFHTTSLSTAATNDKKDILSRYGNREIINALVEKCKELYLLTDTRVAGQVSLAHDLLAPIIRSMLDSSLLPGQKANRLLINQEPYLKNVNDLHPLNQRDLLTLKDGKEGMRAWNEAEKELVRISEKELTRKDLTRKTSIGFFTLAILAIIGTGIALFFTAQSRKLESNRSQALYFNAEARNIMNENPATALHLLRSADSLYPDNINILTTLYNLYNQRAQAAISYRDFYSPFTSPGIEVSPDQQSIILYNAEESAGNKTVATITDINGRPTGTISYHNGSIIKMHFFAKSKKIMTLIDNDHTVDPRIKSYIIITDLKGQVLDSQAFKHQVYDFILRDSNDTYITLELEKPGIVFYSRVTTIKVRSLSSGQVVISHTCDFQKLDAYDVSPDMSFFVYADFGSMVIWNLNTGNIRKIGSPYRTNVTISPDNKWIFAYTKYNGGMLYDAHGSFINIVPTRGNILSARFSPDNSSIVYIGKDRTQVWVWSITGQYKTNHDLNESMKDAFIDASRGIIAVPMIGLGLSVNTIFRNKFRLESNNVVKKVFAFNNNSLFATSTENHVRLWKFSGTNEIPPVVKFQDINGVKIWANDVFVFANQAVVGFGDEPVRICPYQTGVAFVKDTSVINSNGISKIVSAVYFVDSLHQTKLLEYAPYTINHIFASPKIKENLGLVCNDGEIRIIDGSGKNKWREKVRNRRHTWDDINSAAYSLTGDTIFAVTDNGRIFMFNDNGDTINQLAFATIDSSRSIANGGQAQMAVCPRTLKIAVLLRNKELIVYDLPKGTKKSVELKDRTNYTLSPNAIINNGQFILVQSNSQFQILEMQKLSPINTFIYGGDDLGITGDTAFVYLGFQGEMYSYPLPINLRKWLHTVDIGLLPEDYYKQYYLKTEGSKASN